MPARAHLPQLDGGLFLTDGGIETDADLPRRASTCPLRRVRSARRRRGHETPCARYYAPYLRLAARARRRLRAREPDLAREPATGRPRLGYDADAARRAQPPGDRADGGAARRVRRRPPAPIVISGCIGPRGDGYVAGETARRRGGGRRTTPPRSGRFAETAADLVTAITMTYAEEAIGVARAARGRRHARPSISFTVETDGRLPSGAAAAARRSSRSTPRPDGAPAYFMVNCAHPTHFDDVLAPATPLDRAHPRAAGQRVAQEPRRARRGGRSSTTATRRSSAPEYAALRARLPAPQRARRLLRHRPPARRRDRLRLGVTEARGVRRAPRDRIRTRPYGGRSGRALGVDRSAPRAEMCGDWAGGWSSRPTPQLWEVPTMAQSMSARRA